MDETPPPPLDSAGLRSSDQSAYYEQKFFVLSPFGTLTTTGILFAFLAASYAALAIADRVPLWRDLPGGGIEIDPRTRIAFIMSLLFCTALGVQRYVQLRDGAEMPAMTQSLRGGVEQWARITLLASSTRWLALMTIIGVGWGLIVVWLLFANWSLTEPLGHLAIFGWFSVVTIFITMSFTRGVEMTRVGSGISAMVVSEILMVDLLRVDKLSIWGRSAARQSLVWFAVSGVACLFFVSRIITPFTIGLIVAFALIGVVVFLNSLARVHYKIRQAKAAELEQIRARIDQAWKSSGDSTEAALRLQGFIAYEKRIAEAPEWPFDQGTLVRLFASSLILALPWFGQAVAAYLIDHVAAR